MWLIKLDKTAQIIILEFLEKRVATADDPRKLEKKLKGKTLGEHIRFRIDSYRLICDIKRLRNNRNCP